MIIYLYWWSMGAWVIDTKIDGEIAEVCRVRGSRRSCSGCSSAHVQMYSLGRHAIDQSSCTDSRGAAVHNTRASMQIGRLSNASTPAMLAPVLWDETCEETWEESVVTVRERLSRANCAAIVEGVLRDPACARLASKLFGAIDLCPPACAELWLPAAARCAAVAVADEFFGEGGGPVEMPSHQIDGASISGTAGLTAVCVATATVGVSRWRGLERLTGLPGRSGAEGPSGCRALQVAWVARTATRHSPWLTVLNAAGVGARGAGEGGTVRRAIRGGGEVGNGCGGLRVVKGAAVVRCAAHSVPPIT